MKYLVSLILFIIIFANFTWADCLVFEQGVNVSIKISECENTNQEKVLNSNKNIRPEKAIDYKKYYDGALIKDEEGKTWMYPSMNPNACDEFKNGSSVNKKAYYSCCDTGKWGKCMLGGRFLGDLGAEPIDAFQ